MPPENDYMKKEICWHVSCHVSILVKKDKIQKKCKLMDYDFILIDNKIRNEKRASYRNKNVIFLCSVR